MTDAREEPTKEGGFDNNRIMQKPEPVAYISLQICLTWDYYIQSILSATVVLFLFYKVYLYTIPIQYPLIELGAFLVLQCLQFLRIFVGSKGNKTENSGIISWFLLLTLVTTGLLGLFGFILLTYVIALEGLIIVVALLLGVIELALGLFALVSFIGQGD